MATAPKWPLEHVHERPPYEDRYVGLSLQLSRIVTLLSLWFATNVAATLVLFTFPIEHVPIALWLSKLAAEITVVGYLLASLAIRSDAIWYGPYIAIKALVEAFSHIPDPVQITRKRSLDEAVNRAFSLSQVLEQAAALRMHLGWLVMVWTILLIGSIGLVVWSGLEASSCVRQGEDLTNQSLWLCLWKYISVLPTSRGIAFGMVDCVIAIASLSIARMLIYSKARAVEIQHAVVQVWKGTLTPIFTSHRVLEVGIDNLADLTPPALEALWQWIRDWVNRHRPGQ